MKKEVDFSDKPGNGSDLSLNLLLRVSALEADATAVRAYIAALERSVEALRAEVGGLRDLIRRRVPPTPEQFARDLKVEMDAR